MQLIRVSRASLVIVTFRKRFTTRRSSSASNATRKSASRPIVVLIARPARYLMSRNARRPSCAKRNSGSLLAALNGRDFATSARATLFKIFVDLLPSQSWTVEAIRLYLTVFSPKPSGEIDCGIGLLINNVPITRIGFRVGKLYSFRYSIAQERYVSTNKLPDCFHISTKSVVRVMRYHTLAPKLLLIPCHYIIQMVLMRKNTHATVSGKGAAHTNNSGTR